MKTGDIKKTIFRKKEYWCKLMSRHDLNNYIGWWYVNLLHNDGFSIGVVVRSEKYLN